MRHSNVEEHVIDMSKGLYTESESFPSRRPLGRTGIFLLSTLNSQLSALVSRRQDRVS